MGRKKKEAVGVQPVENKKRHVIFLLDETGSMNDCLSDTLGGFNAFIEKQLTQNGDMPFSLTLFNSEKIEKRYVNVPIKNVEKLTMENYQPNHLTPLWDAIGRTIHELNDIEEALFIVLTDGHENHSTEFTSESIRNLIKEKEKSGWQFLYLGADVTNFKDAEALHIVNVSNYSKVNTMRGFANMAKTVDNYYASGKLEFDEQMDKEDNN